MALKVLYPTKNQSRAFLDYLIKEGALKDGFKAILAGRDFPEIDSYILSHNLLNQAKLAEHYAKFYNLPFLRLVDRPIKPSVLALLPTDVAKRYVVVPYELTGTSLHLAIGEPSRLQQNAPSVLVSLHRQKGLSIHLAVVPKADVEAVLRKSEVKPTEAPRHPAAAVDAKPPILADSPQVTPPPVVKAAPPTSDQSIKAAPLPPAVNAGVKSLNKQDLIKEVEPREKTVELKGLTITKTLLDKIPYAVAKRYGLVVFAEQPSKSPLEPSLIKIALVRPDDPHAREIIGYIESKNKVLVDRYKTSDESFQEALKQYGPQAEHKETKPEASIQEEKEEPKAAEEPLAKIKVPERAKEPDVPAVSSILPPIQKSDTPAALEPTKTTQVSGATEGLVLNSDDIVNRPAEGETPQELQRLAKEQENSLESQNLDKLLHGPVTSVEELSKTFKNGVIPEIVAATLFLAIRMKASDVHLEALANAVRVRYRIDGILHDIMSVPHFLHAPLTSRIKILAKMKIDEQRIPQDGRFDVVIDQRQVDLRVSTLPTVHGEKIVMRLLDKSGGILTLEQLGVTGSNFDKLIANITRPYGIILATGPTGSGKSTTLYAALSRLSKPGVNIITLEDPVEYELPGVNQAQVKPQIGFTFAEGLRSVLRQDPNIIMVGEIRDLETAAMATHAALTGHLVLSTLHTNDAAGALPRMINMGVEPFLITSSINAVVGQRLVRKICDKCREKAVIPPALLANIKQEFAAMPSGQMKNIDLNQLVFYHGKGCQFCNNGYSGRIGIYEVLPMSDKIEDLAVRKAPASEIKKAAISTGMITMLQDGLIKALKGITSVDEVMRVTTTHTQEVPGLE